MFYFRCVVCIIFVSLVFISGIQPLQSQEENVIRVGIYEDKPLIFIDEQDNVKGVYADILNYIVEKEGWTIQYRYGSLDDCLTWIKNKEIDVLVAVTSSPERGEIAEFSKESVFSNWGEVYCRNNLEVDSFLDFEGLRVAVVKKDIYYIGPNGIKNLMERFGINCFFVEVDNYSEVIEALESDKADVGIVTRLYETEIVSTPKIKSTSIVFNPIKLLFAFPKGNPNNAYLIETIDSELKKLKSDPNSIYYSSINNYLGGEIGKVVVEVFPYWAKDVFLIVLGSVILLSIGGLILKWQVKGKSQEICKSEDKFRSYVENAPEGIFIVDEKGKYVDVNDAACETTGYTREELLKMNLIDLIPLDDRENAAKSFASVIEKGKNSAETSFIKKGGEKRYWIVNAVKLSDGRFLGFTKDITERKNAELDLIQNEKKYRTLFEDSINPIWTTSYDGTILDTNQAAAELLGYSKEELIGSSVYGLYVDPDMRKQLIAEIKEKGFAKDFLAHWKTKDGRQVDLLFNFTLWKDNEGNVVGYRGIAHDMTLHYRSEKQLDENLEYFAHLIDHIRNPLAILSAFVQIKVDDEKTKEVVIRQVNRIEELLKQLDQGWMDTEDTRKFLKRHM